MRIKQGENEAARLRQWVASGATILCYQFLLRCLTRLARLRSRADRTRRRSVLVSLLLPAAPSPAAEFKFVAAGAPILQYNALLEQTGRVE
jgi:hypothetical protein